MIVGASGTSSKCVAKQTRPPAVSTAWDTRSFADRLKLGRTHTIKRITPTEMSGFECDDNKRQYLDRIVSTGSYQSNMFPRHDFRQSCPIAITTVNLLIRLACHCRLTVGSAL